MPAAQPLALIIEDEASAADALRLVLRDWGAQVEHARQEDDIRTLGPRVAEARWIITDYDLGAGPDGITIARRLAALAPQARILVLSASTDGRSAAAQAGFEVMQKPARADAILAWLARA